MKKLSIGCLSVLGVLIILGIIGALLEPRMDSTSLNSMNKSIKEMVSYYGYNKKDFTPENESDFENIETIGAIIGSIQAASFLPLTAEKSKREEARKFFTKNLHKINGKTLPELTEMRKASSDDTWPLNLKNKNHNN